MSPALALLESALRERHLDRTLTTALPPPAPCADEASAPTGVAPLDAALGGGMPRGQLSELIGPRSSGRTSVLHALVAAATARGELVALVDTLDRLDVESAASAGIDFSRLLWVRGQAVSRTEVGLSRGWHPLGGTEPGAGTLLERTIDRALKAWTQVLQAGGFGLVALDFADVPVDAMRRLPFTTWMRIQRMVEGGETAALLVAPAAIGRSAGGVTLQLQPSTGNGGVRSAEWGVARRSAIRNPQSAMQLPLGAGAGRWTTAHAESARFEGLEVEIRVISARQRTQDEVALYASA